jgi:hypothetical protein
MEKIEIKCILTVPSELTKNIIYQISQTDCSGYERDITVIEL